MTLAVPSSPDALVADLTTLLDVTPVGEDTFEGRRKKGGLGRVFGGQVIAQALVSAERTVADDRPPHSLHAYFLRGGSEDHSIAFHVDRQFDGGSFSNRRVVASQQGRPIFNLAASFHKRETGMAHQEPMPEVPEPESLDNVPALLARFAGELPDGVRQRHDRPSPIELRPVEPRHLLSLATGEPRSHAWFRTAGPLGDDPGLHRAVLAYASDMMLLGTCLRPHLVGWDFRHLTVASLDHALWFHDDFRADEWLLYATDSPWAGRARGLNRGRIYTRDGRLVADVAQEGLTRQIA
jgi:acyl-CoA thioesterase-2